MRFVAWCLWATYMVAVLWLFGVPARWLENAAIFAAFFLPPAYVVRRRWLWPRTSWRRTALLLAGLLFLQMTVTIGYTPDTGTYFEQRLAEVRRIAEQAGTVRIPRRPTAVPDTARE